MRALFRKAYRDLTQRRLRSALTIGAIAIGVAGIVAIVSTAQNLARAQASAYQNASQADITFWVWDAPPKTARALEEIPNVVQAELRNNYFTKCKWNGEYRDVYLWGLNFADARINAIRLLDNAPRAGEFVAETTVRDLFPISAGDRILCRASDGSNWTMTLAGYAASPNYPTAAILNFATVYANAEDVQRLMGISGANQALLRIRDPLQAQETAREAARLLDRRGVQHGTPTVRDPQNYLGKRELDALFVLLTVFSLVGLITSGFLVANTLAAMTAEQIGEIGVVKAIGGTRLQVMTIFMIAALLYGVVGTLAGIVLGTVVSWRLLDYIGALLNLESNLAISPEGIVLGIAVGIGVTLLGAWIPAFAGTAIRVKDALEAYGIAATYGQGRVDRLVQRIIALPPLAAMSLRNLARRKARSLITILVIAVAVAASLAAQSTSASVDAALEGLFQTYHADAWAWFDQWVGTNFAANFRAADGVRAVEVWSIGDAWVGTAKVRLWGVPANTNLYAPRLVEGRWYRVDENDAVVVSTDLAQERKLRLGDTLEIEINDARRVFRIIGITIDNSIFLGSTVSGKVFIDETIVERMQNRLGWATFFALAFDAHDPVSVERRLGELQANFKQYQMGTDSAYREVRGAKEQSRILSFALYAMSLIIGAIGALGVLNTLTLNVLERRREIGVLRSMGAADNNLIQIFLSEGLSLGLVGWVVGIGLGYPLGQFLVGLMQAVLFHIDYIFSWQMIVASLLFALVLAAIASLAPALGAARLRVGQVLRYE
jgi:putative ABC transport system permease protein